MRRFSDGAASIQAFKAHLEKMGNNSSIKQLQQVMEEMAGISGEAWVTETAIAGGPGCSTFYPLHVGSTEVLEVPKQIAS